MTVLERVRASLQNRVDMLVARGILRLIDDSGGLQVIQPSLFAGEIRGKLERLQEFGFNSVPLPECEAVIVFLGGDRGRGFVIATDDPRYRPQGQPAGDSMIYTDQDDPTAAATAATHRLQMTRGKKSILRADEVDIKCGVSTIVANNAGITLTVGAMVLAITAAGITLTVGSSIIAITGSGVTITGSAVDFVKP